ncbi:MAG: NUDIX hydrolase [Mycobacteriaceae bacterium]
MSPSERANPRRRRPRRRPAPDAQTYTVQSRPSNKAATSDSTADANSSESSSTQKSGPPRPTPQPPRNSYQPPMRTTRETSAGGLVVDGLSGPKDKQCAALIGRIDRRGRLLWSLPKGHIEQGETAEQTAMREVKEETGIIGTVLAELGSIDYWFVTEGRRVHKTVHHYLMEFLGGELSDEDIEVTEVAWVPLSELPTRLAYADERKLAHLAEQLISDMLESPVDPNTSTPLLGSSVEQAQPSKAPRKRRQRRAYSHRNKKSGIAEKKSHQDDNPS